MGILLTKSEQALDRWCILYPVGAPYLSTTVANTFLQLAEASGERLTHMKLQKLVYLAHGWYLANSDCEPLIRERVEAWDYGPVIRELYAALATYGKDDIDSPCWSYVVEDGRIHRVSRLIDSDDDLAQAVVDRVWEVYGQFSAIQLSAMTHEQGSPWDAARQRGKTVIPETVIFEHFCKLAA